MNVGAIGVGDEANTMLSKYAKRVDSICENEEFIALVIDSNIHDFYKDFTFQSTHTIRTAAAILALGNTFSYYFYSSGFTYNEVLVKRTSDMAQADPILLPLFSNDVTQFRTVGTHLSRLEKVALVFNQPLSYKYLDVCVAPIEERLSKFNCGVCIKCRRQLITLDIFKGLDKYSEVFIIQDYKKNRKRLFYELTMRALDPERLNNSDFDVFMLAIERGRIKLVNLKLIIFSSRISWKIRNFLAKIISNSFCKSSMLFD